MVQRDEEIIMCEQITLDFIPIKTLDDVHKAHKAGTPIYMRHKKTGAFLHRGSMDNMRVGEVLQAIEDGLYYTVPYTKPGNVYLSNVHLSNCSPLGGLMAAQQPQAHNRWAWW